VARHGGERISQGLMLQLGGQALSAAAHSQPAATQSLILGAYGIGARSASCCRIHASRSWRPIASG